MQLRARKLHEQLPENDLAKLEEIQSSIKIKRRPGTYTLDWRLNNTDYSLSMQSDPFKFYEKGDNAKRNAKRSDNLNYRRQNWDAALQLWRDIFTASGLNSEVIADDGRLAFGDFAVNKSKRSIYLNLAIALLYSLLSTIKYPFLEASQLFITIGVLLFFADNFASVHLRKPVHIIEKLIIAVGCLIPIYFTVNLLGVMSMIAGLCLLGVAERLENHKKLYFSLAGFAFGMALYMMSIFTLTLVGVLFVAVVLISIIDKQRISMISVGVFAAGFIFASLGIFVLIETGNLATYIPQNIVLNQQYLIWITATLSSMLLVGFALWWIIGVQFYLLPWISLLALFIAAGVSLFDNRLDVLIMLGVFTGFTLFVSGRVIRGFFYPPVAKN